VHEMIKFNESGEYQSVLDRTAPKKELPPPSDTPEPEAGAGVADAAKGMMSGLAKGFGKFGK